MVPALSSSARFGPQVRLPLLLLAGALLQPFLDGLTVHHVHPEVLLLLAVAVGLVGGPDAGALAGLGAGLLADLQPVSTPLGLNALALTIVGFAVGRVSETLVRAPWWLGCMVVAAGSAAGTLLYVVLALLMGQGGLLHSLRTVATVVGVVALVNAVISVPVLPVVRWAMCRSRPPAWSR